MMSKESRQNLCCKIKCPDNSGVVMVDAPREVAMVAEDEHDLRLRVWAFMQPPRISDPIPTVNPERLAKVLELLNSTASDHALETNVDSQIIIEQLDDGTIRKTRSVLETTLYPPMQQMGRRGAKKDACTPDCKPVTKEELQELYKSLRCDVDDDDSEGGSSITSYSGEYAN